MPWVYSVEGGVPPSYTYNDVNTNNQHCAAVAIPSNGAIIGIKVYASGHNNAVNTRLAMWAAGSTALVQSDTFSMAVGTESAGGQAWHTANVTAYVVSAGTYWIGLYRNPTGGHIFGTTSTGGGTGYRKDNTAGFPAIASMAGYDTQTKLPYVGVFYITAPSAPTSATVTRNGDTSHTIAWQDNASTDQPYTSLYLERWDNVTAGWYAKTTLTGATTSYTDTTTVANKQYQYRVRAWNAAGYSTYSTTSAINTTPAPVTSVVATRNGTAVDVTWTNPATNESTVNIQKAEYTSAWQSWVNITPDLTANAVNYTDTSPYNVGKYQVRTEAINPTLNSAYTESNSIVVLQPPSPPTNLSPNDEAFDGTVAKTFSWTYNTEDGTAQTAFSIQYRSSGGSFPATAQITISSSGATYEFASGTFTNGINYEYQIKTWGQYSAASSWSDTADFLAASTPDATITNPTVATAYTTSQLIVEWSYTQAESANQTQYICNLYDASDVLLESKSVAQSISSGDTGSATFTYLLANTSSYTVTVQVKDSNGLWSAENEVAFTTSFAVPPTPTFTLTLDSTKGSIDIAITNPSAGVGEVDTVYNDVYRSIDGGTYELILTNVPINTTVTDYTPGVGNTNTYYIEAVSATPTIADSATSDLAVLMTGYYFLNSGSGFEDYVMLKGDTSLSESIGIETTLKQFEGRTYPVKYQGIAEDAFLDFSCDLPTTDYSTLLSIIRYIGDTIYRDYTGRWFYCALTACQFTKKDNSAYQFKCTVTRIEGE